MGNLTHWELKTAILMCKYYSKCYHCMSTFGTTLCYIRFLPPPFLTHPPPPSPLEGSGTDCTFECEDIYNIARMLVHQQRDTWLFWSLFLLSVSFHFICDGEKVAHRRPGGRGVI